MNKRQLMKGFTRPTEVLLEEKEGEKNTIQFIAYPYERGLGTSIGNALRRILLSSVEGYAITALRVTYLNDEGNRAEIRSEFQSIPHVVEDTIEIIANLKGCNIKLSDNALECSVSFEIKQETTVTADIFNSNPNIQVLNPDHHLFTTAKGVDVLFEFQIERGTGYRSAEEAVSMIDVIGTIPIDSIFSPVLHVKLNVEKIRVGQRTDFDKLILDITTDGTVSPQDALAEASKIAKEHFTLFINFNEGDIEIPEFVQGLNDSFHNILNAPISTLDLSARAKNCLEANGINMIGELISLTEVEIIDMKNFGRKSLDEIRSKLSELNLELGMKDTEKIQEALQNPRDHHET